jgi:pseudo-rSAM protein
VSIKGDALLFYNPLNGHMLEYNGNPTILKLARRLLAPANLLVVRLSHKQLEQPETAKFVNRLREYMMGDIVDTALVKEKPIQMMPVAKVHRDAEEIKKSPSRSVGEQLMRYPVEISLYINSVCMLNCLECRDGYRQFLCCTKAKGQWDAWDTETVKNILEQLQSAPLQRINILGGNIFLYPQLDQLAALLADTPQIPEKRLFIHYVNFVTHQEKIALFPPGSFSFSILVTFPVIPVILEPIVKAVRDGAVQAHFLFVVGSDDEVEETENWISRYGIEAYALFPYYNGKNRPFFRRNLFLEKQDLREDRPSAAEILARGQVNTMDFGRLTILNNGNIHANANAPRLGKMPGDSLHQAVYKEMEQGKSWRRIRKKVEPCRKCTFEVLCPPLSNYEYALGQNNLCRIWKKKPVRKSNK